MVGRAWIGVVGVAASVTAVTWFGIIQRGGPAPQQVAATAPATAEQPTAPAPSQPAAAPATPTAPADASSGQQQASAEPAQKPAAAAQPTPPAGAAKPAASLPLPTFDIVRVEPSGDAVVAGQGMPGATVELLRDGTPFARTVADVGGQWAIVPKPLDKGPAELSLRVTMPDGRVVTSEQVVSVRVPENPGEPVVVVLNAPDTPSKVLTADARPATTEAKATTPATPRDTASAQASAPVATAPATTEPAKPVAKAEVAAPAPGAPRANTTIQSVEADESGRFFVSGTAHPGAEIRIYLNETPIASVVAAGDGSFGMTVEKGMTPGRYLVRADDVDGKSGKVLTRAEVPFTMEARARPTAPAAVVTADADTPKVVGARDAVAMGAVDQGTPQLPQAPQQPAVQAEPSVPASVAEAATTPAPAPTEAAGTSTTAGTPVAAATPVTGEQAPAPQATPSVAVVPEIKTVTIARGDNLWRISRKTYGRGIRYTVIYDANTDQIRDPDLIYPGQIFVMPEGPKDEAATPPG